MASYQETNLRKRKHSLRIIQRNSFLKQVSEDRPDEVSGEEGGVDVPFGNRVYYRPEQVDSYDPGLQWREGEEESSSMMAARAPVPWMRFYIEHL